MYYVLSPLIGVASIPWLKSMVMSVKVSSEDKYLLPSITVGVIVGPWLYCGHCVVEVAAALCWLSGAAAAEEVVAAGWLRGAAAS
ncbi:hypothetical protein E2C01_028194 [Portunus trituberculatus]|uniref:Uncharacterized protein n=1 Tax=Portunus trituberculatus TaxID=210409 RepID=A0A5B7EPD3_PORTR|nr:hypothetical protein [Portunus trituberculatus]